MKHPEVIASRGAGQADVWPVLRGRGFRVWRITTEAKRPMVAVAYGFSTNDVERDTVEVHLMRDDDTVYASADYYVAVDLHLNESDKVPWHKKWTVFTQVDKYDVYVIAFQGMYARTRRKWWFR